MWPIALARRTLLGRNPPSLDSHRLLIREDHSTLVREPMSRWTAAVFSFLLLISPIASRADGHGPSKVYEFRWPRELSLLVFAGGATASSRLVHGLGRSPCPCDRTKINALDRGIAGRRSDSADRASDIAAGLVLTAPFAIDALDVRGGEGARQALGTDAAVLLESIA